MRKQFIKSLIELNDPKTILIVGDMGFNFVENYTPLLNCGIMEQSMVGIACGMADEGWKPYVYTNVTFLFRAWEQIRNDTVNRNVVIVGTVGGKSYENLGISHNLKYEDEDTRMFSPFMPVYVPSTKFQVGSVVEQSYNSGPSYIKLCSF